MPGLPAFLSLCPLRCPPRPGLDGSPFRPGLEARPLRLGLDGAGLLRPGLGGAGLLRKASWCPDRVGAAARMSGFAPLGSLLSRSPRSGLLPFRSDRCVSKSSGLGRFLPLIALTGLSARRWRKRPFEGKSKRPKIVAQIFPPPPLTPPPGTDDKWTLIATNWV